MKQFMHIAVMRVAVGNTVAGHRVPAASTRAVRVWSISHIMPDGSGKPQGRQKNRRVEITVKK